MFKRLIESLYWQYYEKEMEILEVDKEIRISVYKYLANEPDVYRFFKAMLAGDKTRYFAAKTDAERNNIKGQYARTRFLVKQIDEHKKTDVKNPDKTGFGGRYA